MEKFPYCVYLVKYCGLVVYVGQGELSRPLHVKSGKSHNQNLNELIFRRQVLGEPDIQVEVYQKCANQENAIKLEKSLIKRFKPAFNKTHCRHGDSHVLNKDGIETLKSTDEHLFSKMKKLKDFCEVNNVNMKLAFTPFGLRVKEKIMRYDTEDYTLTALTLLGKSPMTDDFCDVTLVNGNVLCLKVKDDIVNRLNNILGEDKFFLKSKVAAWKHKTYDELIDYDPNSRGSGISDFARSLLPSNTLFAKRIATYRNIDMVCYLQDCKDVFKIIHLNSGKVIYINSDPVVTLEAYNTLQSKSYKIFSNHINIDFHIDLKECIELETGKLSGLENTERYKVVVPDVKSECMEYFSKHLRFTSENESYGLICRNNEDNVRFLKDMGVSIKDGKIFAKFFILDKSWIFSTTNVKLSNFTYFEYAKDYFEQ